MRIRRNRVQLGSIVAAGLALLASACDAPAARPHRTMPEERTMPACEPLQHDVEFERAPSGHREVDATWLAQHRCAVRIVDVREQSELTSELGHIAGAQWAPLDALDAYAARWPTDEPIVIVDRSGRRSAQAETELTELGFEQVASLTGGMLAWREARLPVTQAPIPTPELAPAAPRLAGDPVRARLADPSGIEWISVASILGSGTEQCIDGRSDSAHIGTPGGDAGELVLALSALEEVTGREVRDDEVAPLLASYAASFGRFYLHSDDHALARLGASLARDPRFDELESRGGLAPDRVEQLVRHPPAALESALLDHLDEPEHVGCGHLRTMLEHPSEYGSRRALVQAVLREAHRLGWAHPEQLHYVVLEGEHEETAVVRVWLDRPIHAYTRVPTFVAAPGETTSFFVAHPEVSAYLRSELGSFLAENEVLGERGIRDEEATQYQRALDGLAERQIAATLRHLARALPVYDVHVSDEHTTPVVSGPNASLGCRTY